MQEVKDKASPSFNQKREMLNDVPLSLSLSPSGHLYLYTGLETSEVVSSAIAEKIHSFFSISESVGLLRLGLSPFASSLSTSLLFWQQFSQLFITEMCKHVDPDGAAIPTFCKNVIL